MRYEYDDPDRSHPTSWWESLRRHLTDLFFPTYRPELHYMRGRGPKWRAKHARPHR